MLIFIFIISYWSNNTFFCLVNKKNIRVINIAIAISVLQYLQLSPYQDLYRRYLDTYLSYSDFTTYADAISGHVDILMYVIALFLKRNDIPFYIFLLCKLA
nr:Uncharacterised protein [Klebsiella pneumoniae]